MQLFLMPKNFVGYLIHWYILSQDQGLYFISEGLETLKSLAHDMNKVVCGIE